MPRIEKLLTTIKKNDPQADLDMVRLAFEFADKAHEGQKRASDEPYINHCVATAQTLAEMKLDVPIIVAALLHDVPEDTPVTMAEIEKNFGADVAQMVAGITKVGKIKYRGMERYIENLRKMFVAMAQDIRVIVIKFADRLHNLQTLGALPEEKRQRIAMESMEIFAPLAGRLGMGEIKGQLEDLAFKYLNPKEYESTAKLIAERVKQKEKFLEKTQEITKKELDEANIKILSFHGRVKHVYSLYRKLARYENDPSKIYDVVALRLIVEDLASCYAALGIVHKLWRPVPNRIRDYIAQPKPNGYQSLHTAVFGENGFIVEFQIRTQKMHEEAEYGIAAYWNYKENDAKSMNKHLAWIKELSVMQKNLLTKIKDLENLKVDFLQNRIFVFTPKGDIIDLPENSTSIDFAYAIHSDVGDHCAGCRINDQMSSLDKPIKNGDMVEIIIDKKRKGPNPGWLKFAKTNSARGRIRSFAKHSIAGWVKEKIWPRENDEDE